MRRESCQIILLNSISGLCLAATAWSRLPADFHVLRRGAHAGDGEKVTRILLNFIIRLSRSEAGLPARRILHQSGEMWLAREMSLNAAAELPTFAKPFYELGFINHLLGDFAGALQQFNQAAARVTGDDPELAARIFHNRGLVRLALTADSQAAIADLKEALRYKPDYVQAKEALRALKRMSRWVPW